MSQSPVSTVISSTRSGATDMVSPVVESSDLHTVEKLKEDMASTALSSASETKATASDLVPAPAFAFDKFPLENICGIFLPVDLSHEDRTDLIKTPHDKWPTLACWAHIAPYVAKSQVTEANSVLVNTAIEQVSKRFARFAIDQDLWQKMEEGSRP